jgi:hypothetical protein
VRTTSASNLREITTPAGALKITLINKGFDRAYLQRSWSNGFELSTPKKNDVKGGTVTLAAGNDDFSAISGARRRDEGQDGHLERPLAPWCIRALRRHRRAARVSSDRLGRIRLTKPRDRCSLVTAVPPMVLAEGRCPSGLVDPRGRRRRRWRQAAPNIQLLDRSATATA